jgi:hypothetical protein
MSVLELEELRLHQMGRSVVVDFLGVLQFFADERMLRKCSTFFNNMIEGDSTAKVYKANLPHKDQKNVLVFVNFLKTGKIMCDCGGIETFAGIWRNAEYLGCCNVLEHLKRLFLFASQKFEEQLDGRRSFPRRFRKAKFKGKHILSEPSFTELMSVESVETLLKFVKEEEPSLLFTVGFQKALSVWIQKRDKFQIQNFTFAQRMLLEGSSECFWKISSHENNILPNLHGPSELESESGESEDLTDVAESSHSEVLDEAFTYFMGI